MARLLAILESLALATHWAGRAVWHALVAAAWVAVAVVRVTRVVLTLPAPTTLAPGERRRLLRRPLSASRRAVRPRERRGRRLGQGAVRGGVPGPLGPRTRPPPSAAG